jgi:hypothetical protein
VEPPGGCDSTYRNVRGHGLQSTEGESRNENQDESGPAPSFVDGRGLRRQWHGPGETIAGRYSLRSMNGETLPFVLIQVVNDSVVVTSGHLQLNDDGTCSSSLSLTVTEGGQVTTETDSDTCTWTRTGSAIFFVWSDNSTDAGSLTGSQISVTSEGVVLLFEW